MDDHNLFCNKCSLYVDGGFKGFQLHLKRLNHIPPYVCGQGGCTYDYLLRSSLYDHIRCHHPHPPQAYEEPFNNQAVPEFALAHNLEEVEEGAAGNESDGASDGDGLAEEGAQGEELPSVSLVESAERSVLRLRSITYMTGQAVQAVEKQAFSLMLDTAAHLKDKVQQYLQKQDKSNEDVESLLHAFDLMDPFKHIMTKPQQMSVFKVKYGLLQPQQINLGHRFDSRQHPKRPRLEPRQIPRSFQYVSIKDILKAVLSDPYLRDLILSEKASEDEYMRTFRDGSLFDSLPPDLKDALRIVIYVDDLEILQALSAAAGIYKIAGIYFGIQNLPPELNSLLTYIFVLALAFAEDAKDEQVWKPFRKDMEDLETNGIEIMVDGEPVAFKVVLVAQIGDSLAACEVLGFRHPSANLFCRLCYIERKEMWEDPVRLGEPRTPAQHALDVLSATSEARKKATGVDGPSLLTGFRFFQAAGHSVFDIFHDLLQGINKMEIKLALRHYICVKKYFDIKELKSRIQFFDYGYPDKKNRPTTNISEDYLRNVNSYNLHQSGSQMWCLTRVFPFLFGDLVPADDPFMHLISLLNQMMRIAFSHAVCESDLVALEDLIKRHHSLFMVLFPGRPEPSEHEEPAIQENFDEPDDEQLEEEERAEHGFQDFFDDLDEDLSIDLAETAADAETDNGGDPAQRRRKRPKIIRMINKHHHLLHYVDIMTKFGPLVNYWCIRYEARHFFFKLVSTVCHNFINPLKTLMEMLQMKLTADKQEPKSRLIMGKRGTRLVIVNDTQHFEELTNAGFQPFSNVFSVQHLTFNGVDLRPDLFVHEKIEKSGSLPKFARVEAIYVSQNQESVYLLTKEWKTLRFEAKFCAFEVCPEGRVKATVKHPSDLPVARLLAVWKRYDSSKLYLAPRTIA